MKKTIILPIILALFFIPCFAQNKKSDEFTALIKIVKSEGWYIPKVDEKEFGFFQNRLIDNVIVTPRWKPFMQKGIETQLDFYFWSSDKTLIRNTRIVEIRNIVKYIANEKTFAYQIISVPLEAIKDRTKTYTGVTYRVFYFDEDGDGKFETRYFTDTMPDKIPNWVVN